MVEKLVQPPHDTHEHLVASGVPESLGGNEDGDRPDLLFDDATIEIPDDDGVDGDVALNVFETDDKQRAVARSWQWLMGAFRGIKNVRKPKRRHVAMVGAAIGIITYLLGPAEIRDAGKTVIDAGRAALVQFGLRDSMPPPASQELSEKLVGEYDEKIIDEFLGEAKEPETVSEYLFRRIYELAVINRVKRDKGDAPGFETAEKINDGHFRLLIGSRDSRSDGNDENWEQLLLVDINVKSAKTEIHSVDVNNVDLHSEDSDGALANYRSAVERQNQNFIDGVVMIDNGSVEGWFRYSFPDFAGFIDKLEEEESPIKLPGLFSGYVSKSKDRLTALEEDKSGREMHVTTLGISPYHIMEYLSDSMLGEHKLEVFTMLYSLWNPEFWGDLKRGDLIEFDGESVPLQSSVIEGLNGDGDDVVTGSKNPYNMPGKRGRVRRLMNRLHHSRFSRSMTVFHRKHGGR